MSVHPTAEVDGGASVDESSSVWNWCQIRAGARIGPNCILGKSVFVDLDVEIGACVKIQNNVSIYRGVVIEDGVFLGPHVCFTNDRLPRAINLDGSLKSGSDWTRTVTRVRYGASIGANATIVAGVTIGRYALVGAGAVVTNDIPDYGLAYGVPARIVGTVCACGRVETGAPCSEPECAARVHS